MPQAYPFKNLIFEGGGVKGIAYAGALETLESEGITPQIERVGGASAGAITATMLSLGYTAAEIKQLMLSMDFTKFEDGGWTGVERIVTHYGWFKGDAFLNFIEQQIEQKTGDPRATFATLAPPTFKALYVMGTDLTTQRSIIFSHEHTPEMAVADAVRISMSIPLFFASRSYQDNVYCDGGVLNNYPLTIFDFQKYLTPPAGNPGDAVINHETLGFHLDNMDAPTVHPINNLHQFIGEVYEALVNIQSDLLMSRPDDVARSVFINNLGVRTTDFHLINDRKLSLMEQGRAATASYLQNYREPA